MHYSKADFFLYLKILFNRMFLLNVLSPSPSSFCKKNRSVLRKHL